MMSAMISKLIGHPSGSVFISSVTTLLIKVASAGLIYAMFVLTARAMTISEFGKFGVGFNLAAFMAIVASGGVHVGINRWWPEYIVKGNPQLAVASFLWGLRVTMAASVVLAVTVIIAAAMFTKLSGQKDFYLVVAGIMLIPMALADYLANALRAQGSIWWAQIPKDVIWRLAACLTALYCGTSSMQLVASHALLMFSFLLAALVALQLLIAVKTARNVALTDTSQVKQIALERANWIKISLPLWGGAVLGAMVQNVDVLLVGALISVEKSGEYFAAVRTVNLIGLMHVAATLVCAPVISRTIHSKKFDELQQIFKVVAALVGTATLLIFLGLIVLGPLLLSFFGSAFSGGYPLLLVLALGFAFNALCGPVGYLLMLTGLERVYLKILIVSYMFSFVAQCVLIPFIGAIGAAIGSSAALIISGTWARRVALEKIGVDPTALCLVTKLQSRENQNG